MSENEQSRIKPKKRTPPWFLGAFVLVLLTVLILLQSSNYWKDFEIESASDTLLLYALSSLNFFAFVIFGFIFVRSLLKLRRERRAMQLGSRIKTKLLLYFFAISLLPIIAMAVFSYLYTNRALERWFRQIPENAISEARRVQNLLITDQTLKLQETANMLAAEVDKREITAQDLQTLVEAGNLTKLEIISKTGDVIAAGEKNLNAEEKTELEKTLKFVHQNNLSEAALSDGKFFDAAAATLSDGRALVVVPSLRPAENVNQLFENSLVELVKLKQEGVTVRRTGFLTLGVLTFLLIFASSWTAFYIARGLTVPIKALAEGAEKIALGNLAHRVSVLAEDELALLVLTFNQMSAKLEENSAELEERRKYIETVLQSLSTGVISFDSENRITTINKAAIQILKLENGDFAQFGLEKLVNEENRTILERLLARAKRIGQASEQTVLQREHTDGGVETNGNLPVVLSATALPETFDGKASGSVLVIEDLSELIAAQRASAWQEVARRMAHEIKNPLTPIQLSAERIAKKFTNGDAEKNYPQINIDKHRFKNKDQGPKTKAQTAKIIKDGTETILREVNSLKSMVDEFSRFARLPNARLEKGNVNRIIEQSVFLYEDRFPDVQIKTNLEDKIPGAMIDEEQLRRAFVNLIENSIEAFDEAQAEKQIYIKTFHDAARDLIVAELSDNGNGISPADFQKLFQPYFSTKGRGTGLGLAIVQRIIGEHQGKIKAVSNKPCGAKFIIELPTFI
ncbi:MAG TPA: ATP-binding protein [Pyrinomonadaceae bacterium]|nr:ATP-binding protein [Pyrinomonadaceae bacterium]